jgi:hypothetical protein
MNIAELFAKDINRSINGVIKVGQQDDTNIRQELEEYVVTEELNKHFYTFFGRFAESIESPTDQMGVWNFRVLWFWQISFPQNTFLSTRKSFSGK